MERHLLVLPDGSELFSGPGLEQAVRWVKLTSSVNPDRELMPGGVCAGMLEMTVLNPEGNFSLEQGKEVTLFGVSGDGDRRQLGVFVLEALQRVSPGTYSVTAYDRVCGLDRDLGQWLADLPGWPYSLKDLVRMVCLECGVTLREPDLLNSEYMVQAFSGKGITGRQILRWAGQLAGRFCRATPEGELEFAWYQPTDKVVTPTGETFYYQDGLSYADFVTAPVQKVQLQFSEEDVGAVYPDDADKRNTMRVTGNYLLTNTQAAPLEAAAKALYEHMQGVTYTPAVVRVPAGRNIRPGDIFEAVTHKGDRLRVYAMTCTQEDGVLTVECTGSARRDSVSAVNQARYEALTGKVLNLQVDVEGLKLENADAKGNLASVALNLEGIEARVGQNSAENEELQRQMTVLQQSAGALTLQLERITDNGVSKVKTETGYTFDQQGLRISRSGSQMENLLDNTGMYVRRSAEVILQANAAGVAATDVTVRNYLVVGNHCRLEDYSDGTDTKRTACFWL